MITKADAGQAPTQRPREHPRAEKLDVVQFARESLRRDLVLPLGSMTRLVACLLRAGHVGEVGGEAHVALVGSLGRHSEPCLYLSLSARLPLVCQRCLGAGDVVIDTDRFYVFSDDEAQGECYTHTADLVEVVAPQASIDCGEWVEDELLLSLPVAWRHDDCRLTQNEAGDAVNRGSPFADLKIRLAKGLAQNQ